jgi:EF hand
MPLRIYISFLSFVLLAAIFGCSQAPKRIAAPAWDPDDFADAILAKLDKNTDGSVDKPELVAAPGLAWGAKYIDADKNGALSREELVNRFAMYVKMRLGLTTKQFQVLYKGRPVAGAKVTLVPEFFLEGVIEPAVGEVFQDGFLDPRVPDIDPSGLRVGYYRVVVESPRVKIPPKYGSAETTPLGVEVSPISDDPISYGTINLVLQDK